jgi:hypothetical protein
MTLSPPALSPTPIGRTGEAGVGNEESHDASPPASYTGATRSNSHSHALILEGGFDAEGQFIFLPIHDTQKLAECFRRRVIGLFLRKNLIAESFSEMLLSWRHSGFSVDLSVKIPATSSNTREALAQYIARPPVPLRKMLVEEHAGIVLYRSEYNPYFHTESKLFPATEFLVEVLQHLPDAGTRLIRRYGLYSSRSRGTWSGQAPPCPPGSRGVAEGPTGAASSAPRHTLPGHPGSVRVGQRVPLRLGTTARKDLRGQSLALRPLWFPDAGPRRHCRSPAGPQDPPPPHQDRRGPTGTRRRFSGLTLLLPRIRLTLRMGAADRPSVRGQSHRRQLFAQQTARARWSVSGAPRKCECWPSSPMPPR